MIFVDGKDTGYKETTGWWDNPADKDSFRIANPNDDYPKEYFANDHVSESVVMNYCNNVIREYELFAGKRLKSIAEFGCGGGWFTKEFLERGYDILYMEASKAGRDACWDRGIYNAAYVDFRKYMPSPGKPYDIALCTEVAGHIEPPFSSMLGLNLVRYANVIWWSSEEPFANKPHLHHPNEQPYQYWINLFKFYGFEAVRLSDEIFYSCEMRGRYIFYSKFTFPQK